MEDFFKDVPPPDPNWVPPYTVRRANAYPSIVDQLDTLYHGGYEAWRAQIKAVKDARPKEEPTE